MKAMHAHVIILSVTCQYRVSKSYVSGGIIRFILTIRVGFRINRFYTYTLNDPVRNYHSDYVKISNTFQLVRRYFAHRRKVSLMNFIMSRFKVNLIEIIFL